MESHPYAKNRGVGTPSDNSDAKVTDVSRAASEAELCQGEVCQHVDARGHRCRMLVMNPNETLCPHHQDRLVLARRQREVATAELTDCLNDFDDAESVFRFLTTLLKHATAKRIPRRDAVTLAYICQTILNTHAAGFRELSFQRDEERFQALAAAKRPPKVIWDIPHPPYEPDQPVENLGPDPRLERDR